jgi:hypothetical protein
MGKHPNFNLQAPEKLQASNFKIWDGWAMNAVQALALLLHGYGQDMRCIWLRGDAPEAVGEVKLAGLLRAQTQPPEMLVGVGKHSLHQCPASAPAPMRARDIKPADSTDAWVRHVWIAIKSANTHHLIANSSKKQRLARCAEPVRAGSPLVAQTLDELVTLMQTLSTQLVKSVQIEFLDLGRNHAVETQCLPGLFAQGLRREALPDP